MGYEKLKKYIIDDPQLMKDWNWVKNDELGLFPNILTLRSNKKVWWQCCENHEYECTPDKRYSGQNCPYCSNKRVMVGFNDIQSQFPELAQEWDYENNSIPPDKYVVGSAKVVAWKCSMCGFNWVTSIRNRTQRNTGCPQCSKQIRIISHHETVLKRSGCLNIPLLIKEWDYEKNAPLLPADVTNASNKKVWWQCSKCHYKWEAKVCNRAKLERGCPCCANKVTVKGINDLATSHPELAKEWHPTKNGAMTPFDVTYGCGKKVWWKCPLGHEYQATVLHRSHGTNCPICNSGRQTSFAEQAVYFYIKKIYPEALNRCTDILGNRMELDIYIPSIKAGIEYDGVYWHKSSKNKEREKVKYQICQEKGIKLIRIKEASIDAFDMASDDCFHMDGMENPDVLNMLIRHLLDKLDPKSNMWTRKNSYYFHSQVSGDVIRDKFEIRTYMTELKENSLAKLRPDLVQEWHPTQNGTLTPAMFSLGSDEKVWWKCSVCGSEWETSIGHRVKGTGCNECYRKRNKEQHPLAKIIYQYSSNGEFIQEWKSISEASRMLSINSSNITMCAKHQRNSAGGFRWTYDYVEKL